MAKVKTEIFTELIPFLKPGDILLTKNPAGLGKLINWGQKIEQGDPSEFGHVAIVAKAASCDFVADGSLYESVKTIARTQISDYIGKRICIMRHVKMCQWRFFKGREQILDNIGQFYPAWRLLFHGLDMAGAAAVRKLTFGKCTLHPRVRMARMLNQFGIPVCSELAKQFLDAALGLICNKNKIFYVPTDFERIRHHLLTGIELKQGVEYTHWSGVNPDHFDDARQEHPELWKTIFHGQLTGG